jgi:hypothetical protein
LFRAFRGVRPVCNYCIATVFVRSAGQSIRYFRLMISFRAGSSSRPPSLTNGCAPPSLGLQPWANLLVGNEISTISPPPGKDEISEEQARIFKAVLPHIDRAIRIHRRLQLRDIWTPAARSKTPRPWRRTKARAPRNFMIGLTTKLRSTRWSGLRSSEKTRHPYENLPSRQQTTSGFDFRSFPREQLCKMLGDTSDDRGLFVLRRAPTS